VRERSLLKNIMLSYIESNQAQRTINYLRISVTDRCNLKCRYCFSEEGVNFIPHEEILSYEELLHLVRLSTLVGIRKIRVTGGEPLVRKGIEEFLFNLCHIKGLQDISLTTNGILLKEMASRIKSCGIKRLNISLDSLKPERFAYITGKDEFHKVWEGIREAERVGFYPLKINLVVMKGINYDEIIDFARLAIEKPYHIRFIELMPIANNGWRTEMFVSVEEMFDVIKTLGPLKPLKSDILDGPAQRYVFDEGKGEIGLIGAVSNHFCNNCNRLRLTAEGHLRGCLFSDDEIDLKSPLRAGEGDSHLLDLMGLAIQNKPRGHGPLRQGLRTCSRRMSSIGG
jgi:GTP 3',8-cyclase